jgi:DNA mismatch endonuclease, patch repair protein
MVDVVDKKTRSRMMSGIRGKNTKPELVIRKALFRQGFRYKLHDRNLPGKPDLVFPQYQAVIFIHGCFWHKHECHLFKWPSTRPKFWKKKLEGNVVTHARNIKKLKRDKWYILTIWECALKGKSRLPLDTVIEQARYWLEYEFKNKTIKGKS